MKKINNPFLSIVIPVYNKEKYVEGCICSVLAQSYGNIEIIVVNDGSTDNTAKVLNSFSDSRMKVIETDNNGVSIARNIGIKNSNGKYIIFIDGDDTVASDYCERIANAIFKYDYPDLLIFGLEKRYPSGTIKRILPFAEGKITIDEFKSSFMLETSEKEGIYGYICNKAIKREIIIKSGAEFNSEIKLAEDFDFWLQIYSSVSSLAMSLYSGYNYIQETEESSVFFVNNYSQLIGIWLRCYKYLSLCGGSNSILLQCRIWGLCEAKLLELPQCNYTSVKTDMQYISTVLSEIEDNDRYNPKSCLQYLMKIGSVGLVYLYLNVRRAYHKLRL
ncbi:MAG: glycosyltransferase family 2 protein [Muribaculaceae bacterium]|nr:glycosyltransferase family 2 protein [Muribaculaceae bacterium]